MSLFRFLFFPPFRGTAVKSLLLFPLFLWFWVFSETALVFPSLAFTTDYSFCQLFFPRVSAIFSRPHVIAPDPPVSSPSVRLLVDSFQPLPEAVNTFPPPPSSNPSSSTQEWLGPSLTPIISLLLLFLRGPIPLTDWQLIFFDFRPTAHNSFQCSPFLQVF